MATPEKRGENPAKGYLSRYVQELPSSTFTNEYGEKFTIHSNGTTAFMSGDEVNAMVDEAKTFEGYIPLFNPNFNVWNKQELYKLGEALQDVAKQNGYNPLEEE